MVCEKSTAIVPIHNDIKIYINFTSIRKATLTSIDILYGITFEDVYMLNLNIEPFLMCRLL